MAGLAGRTIMAMLTILYTLLSMASCSAQEQARAVDSPVDGIPQQAAGGGVELRILHSRGESGYALQQAADLYRQQHPEVRIQIYTVADEHDYRSTLRSRLAGGEPVDLFQITGYGDLLELEDNLLDLGRMDWVRDAAGGLLEPVTKEEAVLGIPYSMEGLGLLCNREVFASAGISLDGIVDMEDLEQAFADLYAAIIAGELAEEFPDLELVAAFAGQDRAFLGEQLADIALAGEFVSAQQAQASNAIAFAGWEEAGRYVDLMLQYSSGGRGWSWLAEVGAARQLEDLAAGRVAVIQGSTQSWTMLEALNPALDLQLLAVPLAGEEAGTVRVEAPAYWAVNAQSDSGSVRAAVDVLEWLYCSDEGGEALQNQFGILSPYADGGAEGVSALHRQLQRHVDNGRTSLRRYREFPSGWSAAFAAELRLYLTELDKTWEQVAVEVRASWIDLR